MIIGVYQVYTFDMIPFQYSEYLLFINISVFWEQYEKLGESVLSKSQIY